MKLNIDGFINQHTKLKAIVKKRKLQWTTIIQWEKIRDISRINLCKCGIIINTAGDLLHYVREKKSCNDLCVIMAVI